MKQNIQFIIYSKEIPKSFTGILGELDVHVIHFLLTGGKTGIQEHYEGKDPVEWYCSILKEQDMYIKSTYKELLKGALRIWIEIDSEKTSLDEYTTWHDIDQDDTESLVWKSYSITCMKDSLQECLGLAVTAKETFLFTGKHPLTFHDSFKFILSRHPKG